MGERGETKDKDKVAGGCDSVLMSPGESSRLAPMRFPRSSRHEGDLRLVPHVSCRAYKRSMGSSSRKSVGNRKFVNCVWEGKMANQISIVGDVPELDFAAMVMEHLSGDEAVMALPFLKGVRFAVAVKEDSHLGEAKKYQKTLETIDEMTAVALEMVGHQEQQEAEQEPLVVKEQEPQEVDVSQIRCGNATAADIKACRKFRHALAPIARRNGGLLDLKDATDLIVAVMKPKSNRASMKANLGKFLRGGHSLGEGR